MYIEIEIDKKSDEEFEALKKEAATANGDLGIVLLKREEEIKEQLKTQNQ